ncbi:MULTISPECIES: hypothetical protein [unclassified Archaeoglobus]|jgi:hypothetical protein|uniref:hypothetical protein n=1 Tax=unclassified Archaeoglobus TaxID=2643606 RepID=UPI0025BF63A0|nr:MULTISPECIES: hypothetical protein [unclassified Archaeoglobus]
MQKIKKFLLFLIFTTIAAATVFLLVFVPFVEQFTDLPALVRLDIDSKGCLDNFTLLFPVYVYQNKSFEAKHFDLRPGSVKNYSISTVETKYGKMWEIKIKRINRSGGVVFDHPYNVPLDILDIKLKPVLNESVIKDERMGRYYEKVANLTIPVYVYYEGNATEVKVTFYADSGQDCFLGLIPVAPKHNGEVYSGHRYDEFVIKYKGWENVTGTSTVYLVYQ